MENLGYELLDLEFLAGKSTGAATIRLFIDFSEEEKEKVSIGIEDCILVDKRLSVFLEGKEFEAIFSDPFNLEVSSPGIDKPLRKREHFKRNIGKNIVVKTYRPLTEEELENAVYQEKNPKQKSFLGKFSRLEKEKIFMAIDDGEIGIPFSLISKARLSIAKML